VKSGIPEQQQQHNAGFQMSGAGGVGAFNGKVLF
jgi:hypothetical protein